MVLVLLHFRTPLIKVRVRFKPCFFMITHVTFNSDILSFFKKELECKILVKIPDSVLDSALALQGKEGDIVREKL